MADPAEQIGKMISGQNSAFAAAIAAFFTFIVAPFIKNTYNAAKNKGAGDELSHSNLISTNKRLDEENKALRLENAELDKQISEMKRESVKGLIVEDKLARVERALLKVMSMFERVSQTGGILTAADAQNVRDAIEIVLPPSAPSQPAAPLRSSAAPLPGPDETPQGAARPRPVINAEDL